MLNDGERLLDLLGIGDLDLFLCDKGDRECLRERERDLYY